MKNSQNSPSNFEQLYQKISPEIQKTLTHEQLQAIKTACESNDYSNSNRHALDIRVSLPIPGLRFYVVLLAGKERRSKKRLQYEKGVYPLRNPVNILFLSVLFIILSTSSITIFQFIFSSISFPSTISHPASIPWIDNQVECQNTKRIWQDNKCWDAEHNPTF
ncbi:hypothetical protein [Nodularia sp. UHCC 0506]|uniref:hypothetical protein n=1 Tax=Nodularia sp. UHCC 0506 TaxID=3110243 RepID=UPI002B2209AA|nr:hypothetical protein [Nodularia sp. UHCC 0506]MEA5515390.1 hypothetical protein [Nodularia sp. UHCC 0506]